MIPVAIRMAALLLPLALAAAPVSAQAQLRAATPAEQAQDATAFAGMATTMDALTDVTSVVVLQGGRVAWEYHRDSAPDTPRDLQSVAKSALALLVGAAHGQGLLPDLDVPVVQLVPAWAALNADPRAATITVRHLLTMSAGFAVNDAAGTASAGRPADAWARPLAHAPGTTFAYDNALIPVLVAVLQQVTGQPLQAFARQALTEPLGLAAPTFAPRFALRTRDLAALGQLALQRGQWQGRQLVPADYIDAATRRQNAGGPPVSVPYGYLWWVLPSDVARPAFFASGWGGQFLWVDPARGAVLAVTSQATPASQQRGHALQLIRAQLLPRLPHLASTPPR